MAKPVAPLLGFSASGTIAKTIVYARWRGRSYGRRWTSPHNPRSTSQLQTRHVFSWLQQVWKQMPTLGQAPWTAYAAGKPLTNRNAFGTFNIAPLRTATVLTNLRLSPGANAGIAPLTITATPGAAQLSVAITAPTPPAGWTLSFFVAAAIRDQDPHSGLFYVTRVAEAATSPVVITGLTSAQLHQVRGWLIWSKPDLSLGYGPDIATTGTPT
jgi:hypothetical protein